MSSRNIGSNPLNLSVVSDLHEMITQTNLIDGGYTDSNYTWHNKRMRKKAISDRLELYTILNGILSLKLEMFI